VTFNDGAQRINFSWLIRLRWGAVIGQLLTIAVVQRILHIALPLVPLLAVVALEAASNLAALLWLRSRRPVGEAGMALTMALDIVLLTTLLFFTGGPFNPFSFLYLVHIALAAVVLRSTWTWVLVALSLGCSAALFYGHLFVRLDGAAGAAHLEHMELHLQGMWIAFAVAAGFIVYFVTRVRRALAERETDLAAQRAVALRNERLASLATLAAGAAHELATPLGTIAVAARELERQAERRQPSSLDDVRLIRAQIERCRSILDHLAADAGESAGEAPVTTTVAQIVDEAVRDLPPRPPVRLELGTLGDLTLLAPPRALGQALRVLVKNAQEASASGSPVRVQAAPDPRGIRMTVHDVGQGMSPEVLSHAGEPFFTTKPTGRGLGLGLFLARTVVEQLGGGLDLRSVPGRGTTATLVLATASPALPSPAAQLPDGRDR
jgi:two-component system sensor histidine kinase RegB